MDKEKQKQLITEIMNEDAKDRLYEPAKTATEWLFIQLYEKFEMKGDGIEMDKVLEQAKAMEKEQITHAWENGALPDLLKEFKNSRIYYNETYGKDSN